MRHEVEITEIEGERWLKGADLATTLLEMADRTEREHLDLDVPRWLRATALAVVGDAHPVVKP